MLCSKIGSDCPHQVGQDDNFVFVMMPFTGFDNMYYTIQSAVEGIEGKDFECMRADEKYTTFAIWCQKICKNIRKAKYLIVDTTGRNPNVFYELGFSHALENTKAILVTQNVKDAPFDISDLNHIEYSPGNLRDLREKLQKAILELEKEEEEEGYENKTSDEMIAELKSQLREEEERASKFKKELHESEDRESDLKLRIKEVEAIKDNPVEEAKTKITKLEGTIAELKSNLKFTEKDKKDKITRLSETLKEKEKKLKILEDEFESYKNSKNEEPLSTLLLDDTKRQTEAKIWYNKGYDEGEKGNYEKAIDYYTKAIELKPDYAAAYINRGNIYNGLKEYEKAINDFNKAIELEPDIAIAYNNRGIVYYRLKKYGNAINDYNKAIEVKPDDADAYQNLTELHIITGNCDKALITIRKALDLSLDIDDRATFLYLECIAKKMLDVDVAECERDYNEILKKDFETTWRFDEIESWLTDADIDEDKKDFIIEKTEQLKKHKT